MKILNQKTKKFIGCIFIAIACIVMLFLTYWCFSNDIWYDEVFSVNFASHSYSEIIALTAQDVHPPLYYFYIKWIADIFHILFQGFSEITLYKIASVLPFAGIMIYAVTFVRKRSGIFCAGIFILFLVILPQLPVYAVEIRMYSLALFFITAAFLHAYELICGAGKKHFIFMFLYGIMTAYTQYYACAAIIALYLMLFFFFLYIDKTVKKRACYLLVMMGGSVILYLPWLPVLLKQMKEVSSGYWIEPLSLRSIPGCLKYIFLPVSYDTKVDYCLAVCMIFICVFLLFCFIRRKAADEERFLVYGGIMIPVFVFAIGFLFSLMNRPIFVYRYLVPALGVFWLAVSYELSVEIKKNGMLVLLLPFFMGGFFNMKGFYQEELKKTLQMQQTQEEFSRIEEDAVIITNFDHVQAVSAYYLKNQVALYEAEPSDLMRQLEHNCFFVMDDNEIKELLKSNKVYFFGSFQVREDIIDEWQKKGIMAEEKKSCLLERYWFNIYELEMEK